MYHSKFMLLAIINLAITFNVRLMETGKPEGKAKSDKNLNSNSPILGCGWDT